LGDPVSGTTVPKAKDNHAFGASALRRIQTKKAIRYHEHGD